MRQPWAPADATLEINALGADPRAALAWTLHARDRMAERDLSVADVLHVLRRGFVYRAPEPAAGGLYKYEIQSRTPNSEGREIAVVVVPDPLQRVLKVVTVMWVDEPSRIFRSPRNE